MIAINLEICDGCGACVATCPNGALYLVDDRATVDAGLCRGCEACIAACPRQAIVLLSKAPSPQAEALDVLVPRPEAEVIRVRTQPVRVSWRSRVLPLVGATAAWAGRELVPLMAEYLLDRLERRAGQQPRAVCQNRCWRFGAKQGGAVAGAGIVAGADGKAGRRLRTLGSASICSHVLVRRH